MTIDRSFVAGKQAIVGLGYQMDDTKGDRGRFQILDISSMLVSPDRPAGFQC